MVKLFLKNSNLCDHNSLTSQTDGQTDRQTTCDRNTALCTKVHRAVKTAPCANRNCWQLYGVYVTKSHYWDQYCVPVNLEALQRLQKHEVHYYKLWFFPLSNIERQVCTGLLMCTVWSVNVAPCPGQNNRYKPDDTCFYICHIWYY